MDEKDAEFRRRYGQVDPEAGWNEANAQGDVRGMAGMLEGFTLGGTITGRTQTPRSGIREVPRDPAGSDKLDAPARYLTKGVAVQDDPDRNSLLLVLGYDQNDYAHKVTLQDLLEIQRVVHGAIVRGGPFNG